MPNQRLPFAASAALTLGVIALAAVVLFGVASAAGMVPPTQGPTSALVVAGPSAGSPIAPAPTIAVAQPTSTASGAAPSAQPTSTSRPVASSVPVRSAAPASVGSAPPAASPVASAAPKPSPAAPTKPSTTSALKPPPTGGPFSMDLYRKGDYVEELTKVMCVPAAMQTMINILSPGADTSAATQQRLYALARRLSPKTLKGDGAEPEGWANGLNQLGDGPYAVDVEPTRVAAIHEAARAIRLTGRPVGILAWRGAHSWVMSGFKATADPAFTSNFRVTDVFIEDVWYPRVSSIWGASRKPDSLVPVALLHEDILPWHRPTGAYPGKDGKYVLVLPVAAD